MASQQGTICFYGVDLYLTMESQRPEVREVLQVRSRRAPSAVELVKDVMLAYDHAFVASALVEQLVNGRPVSWEVCRNVSCSR